MTANEDHPNFTNWAQDWQAGAPAADDAASVERIRQYVTRRGRLVRSFRVADFVVGAIALPVLGYRAWIADNDIERAAMIGLAAITIAATAFGWWNSRGILQASATTTSEYAALSAERLRRLRFGWRMAWVVLLAQVVVFTIWIWNRLYSSANPPHPRVEQLSWAWLAGFTLIAVVSLLWFGRWLSRDAARFEDLRRELDA
jgi:hypothetical protein